LLQHHLLLLHKTFSMLSSVLRAAARPALRATTVTRSTAARTLATSAVRRGGHASAPSIFGAGGKAGEIPTDEEQATGLARLQLLGDLEGTPVFDYAPLESDRVGTLDNPVKVYSLVRDPLHAYGHHGLK
jgi:cytochrome c oxidase subunit 5b